jgi:hypothetical protein
VGAIDQPGQTVSGIPGQPRVQGLARDPELGRHHDLGFTTPDRKDGAIALLDNRALRCFKWVTQREVMYAGVGSVRLGSWSLAAVR